MPLSVKGAEVETTGRLLEKVMGGGERGEMKEKRGKHIPEREEKRKKLTSAHGSTREIQQMD